MGKPFILPQVGKKNSQTAEQSPQITNTHTIIQLGRRKSSQNASLSPGVPFLTPTNNNQNKGIPVGRKNFFIQKSRQINTREVLTNILNQVGTLSKTAVIMICQSYQLIPPCHATLFKFVSEISPNDRAAVEQLHNRITNITQQIQNSVPLPSLLSESRSSLVPIHQKMIIPSFLPVERFHFLDPRYSHSQYETQIMQNPMPIAHENQDFVLSIPEQPIGTHMIIQSFTRDGRIYWPSTLRIYVNDLLVKGPGVCKFNQIDISQYPMCQVRFLCNRENLVAALIVRPAVYTSFKELVNAISTNHSPHDVPITDNEQALCPITGKMLKYPGRGINCQHLQCFNLKEYIKRATSTRQWLCPICNIPVNMNQLMYSHEMENKINAAKESENKTFDEFNPENEYFQGQGDGWI